MDGLKSLYDYGTSDMENILDIRSETVEPLTSSAKKAVFRLEPTGYLDENSLLQFKLKSNVADVLRMNVFNGGLGAIKRVIFSVGDYILNDVNDVNEWATLHNLLKKSRATQNSLLSHYLGNQFYTKVADSQVKDAGGIEQQGVGEIIPDVVKGGLSVGGHANASSTDGAYDGKVAQVNSLKITQTTANNHKVGIPLGMIIPALQGRTIPLFLFSEYRIYITVEFNDADKFVNNIAKTNYAGGETLLSAATDVAFQEVKLQVDYIIEPAEMIEKVKKQVGEKGYVMDFFDVVKVEKQLPSTTNKHHQKVEFKLGQNNREVHKIYMTRNFTDNTGIEARSLALLNNQRIDGVNTESVNWYINGRDIYPESDVLHNLYLYDQMSEALGQDLSVERPMYDNSLDSQHSSLASPTNPLGGTYKPLGLDLRNGNPSILGGGTMVGNFPILCKYGRIPVSKTARSTGPDVAGFKQDMNAMNVNFYIMASRRAVITSGIKRNDVAVSY